MILILPSLGTWKAKLTCGIIKTWAPFHCSRAQYHKITAIFNMWVKCQIITSPSWVCFVSDCYTIYLANSKNLSSVSKQIREIVVDCPSTACTAFTHTNAIQYLTINSTKHSQHTHTQPFYCWSGICPGPPGSAGTRKVKPRRLKPIWIYWSKR